jgi:predicted Fe-Mo cluster-binding NifX family protein
MRVAIPTWCDRVSPVFDVARRILVVDADGGVEVGRTAVTIKETEPGLRSRRLAELGVDTVICGAISSPLESMLMAARVHVIPHACGPVELVLRAFLTGGLSDDAFLMPGYCHRRRRKRGRQRRGRSTCGSGEDAV